VGVVGLAVGFAAQATIANVLSGFGIFINDLYRKGHWVKVADHYGEVAEITLRTTKIRTLDNTCISVPNSLITSSPVINYSEQGKLRLTVHLSIGYDESIAHAREVLIEAVQAVKGVLKKPEPLVVVKELGNSAVHLMVRVWVSEPGFEQKYSFLLTEVCKDALDKAGIKIPYPQTVVHYAEDTKSKRKTKKK
jgi:small conductance mechanosensitive channel